MTLKSMYPAAINSPGTELAADITATATEITVLSTNELPPAPNLLTLGSDETAETVRYTKIDGTKLTVERGFQGVAKSWSAGTRVARYFTAYDHDTFRENIEAIDAETSDVERKDLTLNVGLQIVESAQDTPFQFGEIRGQTEIRDGDGIVNVTNPYAIVTGGNLLPPFYEWSPQGVVKVTSQYEAELTPTTNEVTALWCDVPTSPNTDYILTIGQNGATMSVTGGSDGTIIVDNTADTSAKFNSGDRNTIRVYVSNYLIGNETPSIGNFTFKNPMLAIGTEPMPFTPQQRSMLAFETELAAHPVDGSNPDTLFMGDDGLPYVLEPWKKVTLGGALNWSIGDSTPQGGKQLKVSSLVVDAVPASGYVTKYDGKYIPTGTTGDAPDLQAVSVNGSFYISIANTDSGWGQDYTPTADEIKAYFYGYRLLKADGSLYDGNGQRYWNVINPDGSVAPGQYTTTLPTQPHSQWTPYRLQYLKAKPTVEPVRNYELGATLSTGPNMVEVGSGIVIREKANPALYADNYVYLNNKAVDKAIGSNCSFRYKASTLRKIYKDRANEIRKWTILHKHDSAYGDILALISQSNFDPHAVYHVTYTMLDPTLAAPFSGTVAANLRGTVSDLVQDVGDVQRRLSVVETQKAEKAKKAVWIELTPLNGWGAHPNIKPAYAIMDGVVYFKGRFTKANATTADGTVISKIPEKVSPMYTAYFQCVRGRVSVFANGDLQIYNNEGTADLSIDNISYPLER